MWYRPCGEDIDTAVASLESFEEEANISLESLKLQYRLTMNDYLVRDYNYLYEQVHFGLDKRQYIPNWLPGKRDVELVKNLTNADSQTVSAINDDFARFDRAAAPVPEHFAVDQSAFERPSQAR